MVNNKSRSHILANFFVAPSGARSTYIIVRLTLLLSCAAHFIQNIKPFRFFAVLLSIFILCIAPFSASAQKQQVEVDGDEIEYLANGEIIIIRGNVFIQNQRAKMFADEVEYSRQTGLAKAIGNVRLISDSGEITGDKLNYNFLTDVGDLQGMRLFADPYYVGAEKTTRVSEEKFLARNGFLSTSDFDDPEWRIQSKNIEVYPNDKIVAKNVWFKVGPVPLFWLPRYTHSLDDTKPIIKLTPGYDSDWGAFLLADYRFYLSEKVRANISVDYRELRDVASGFDLDYEDEKLGKGLFRSYYTNEREIFADRIFDDRDRPTDETERYKFEWRHKLKIDDQTQALWQYYRLSDNEFLKDYFEREFDKDPNPESFFYLTRTLPLGTLSFQYEPRVNRFETKTERLPELRFDMSQREIGDSNFYFTNTSSLAKLTRKTAEPSEIRQKTTRFDFNNELSYPFKFSIVEFKPFIGTQHTYYSRSNAVDKDDRIRGIFRTGTTASTKFYRVFDAQMQRFGLSIDKLRHIITPSISYLYTTNPTVERKDLNNFDGIDTITRTHEVIFSLENKLQTKRNGKTVDLLRAVVENDYLLKEDPRNSGFNRITTEVDFKPTDWLTLYFDSDYDTRERRLDNANFDIYLNPHQNWYFGVGKRYDREVDDQVTAEIRYQPNPKWEFRFYERFDIDRGQQKEQEITVTRDLHSWKLDVNYNITRGQGAEVYFMFTLKAFPDVLVESGTSFNERKRNSQAFEN